MTDPFRTLGLAPGATVAEVRAARRDLAKRFHPDTGGDPEKMRDINAAAGQALHLIAQTETTTAPRPRPRRERAPEPEHDDGGPPHHTMSDVPSFTIEALPAEAFEALVVVTSWIGEMLDDDPPYRLDAHLLEPCRCWCRLDLVPDAGASTVSISLARSGDDPLPTLEAVRDTWIEQLNRYDWS